MIDIVRSVNIGDRVEIVVERRTRKEDARNDYQVVLFDFKDYTNNNSTTADAGMSGGTAMGGSALDVRQMQAEHAAELERETQARRASMERRDAAHAREMLSVKEELEAQNHSLRLDMQAMAQRLDEVMQENELVRLDASRAAQTAQHEAEMLEKDLLASREESQVLAKKCAELERHVAYIEQFLLQKGRAAPAPPASD